jgi:hypothetical protein
MLTLKHGLYGSALLLLFAACKKDDPIPVDQNLPLVNIFNPQEPVRTFTRDVFIKADVVASGNKLITRVEFTENGTLLPGGELTAPPYELHWTVTSGFDTPRELLVTAYDDQGFSNSDTVTVIIWNGIALAGRTVSRYAFTADAVNGRIYVIGGYSDQETAFKLVEEYHPAMGTWSAKTSSTFGHAGHTSCVVNNKIYVFGGDGGQGWHADSEVYDPSTDTWSMIEAIPTDTNVGKGLQASAALNDVVYLFGGEASALPTVTGVYNTTTNSWSPGAIKHTFNASAITLNGVIYLTGGCPEFAVGICGSPSKSTQTYDPTNMTFSTLADMNHERFGHSTCVHDGKIYAFGGSSNSASGLATAEVYDPGTNEWIELPNLPEGQINAGCVTIDNTIYLLSDGTTAYAYTPN